MKKKYRFFAVILCIIMLVTSFSICVSAKKVTAVNPNDSKTYEIAVVYDNSGSMFVDKDSSGNLVSNKAWSRAKYAMQVFASMLPFDDEGNLKDGNKLSIFPMWKTTDGKDGADSPYPLCVTNNSTDIEGIGNMYTPEPGQTPITPIEDACDALSKSAATEKWLVVMTDGAFNRDIDKETGFKELALSGENSRLNKYFRVENNKYKGFDVENYIKDQAKGYKVAYLSMGDAAELDDDVNSDFYAYTASENNIREKLIEISNNIFDRLKLPDDSLSDNGALKLDLPMSKLFIVAQGDNVSVELKDSESNVKSSKSSIDISYSKQSAGNNDNKAVGPTWNYGDITEPDTKLKGQVITYGNLDSGEYTLTTSGAKSISIYYEPDVLLKTTLTGKDGKEIALEDESEITAGEYTVKASLVDKNGNDVTDNKLLKGKNGDGVTFGINLFDKNKGKTKLENGKTVTISDSATGIGVIARFLDGYSFGDEEDATFTLKTSTDTSDDVFSIDVAVQQKTGWYNSKKIETQQPIVATVKYNGEKLSAKKFAKLKTEFTVSPDLIKYIKEDPENSCYYIYIGTTDGTNYSQVSEGDYKITGTVIYTNELGTFKRSDDARFDIHSAFIHYLRLIVFALVMLVLLIIAAVVIYFLFIRSYYPKKMYIVTDDGSITVRRNKDKCRAGDISFLAHKNKKTTFFKRSTEKARINIRGLTFSDPDSVRNFTIDGTDYQQRHGQFVNGSGSQYDMEEEMIIAHGDEIMYRDNTGITRGTFRMNKKK